MITWFIGPILLDFLLFLFFLFFFPPSAIPLITPSHFSFFIFIVFSMSSRLSISTRPFHQFTPYTFPFHNLSFPFLLCYSTGQTIHSCSSFHHSLVPIIFLSCAWYSIRWYYNSDWDIYRSELVTFIVLLLPPFLVFLSLVSLLLSCIIIISNYPKMLFLS